MTPTVSPIVYTVLILLASVLGGSIPLMLRLTHKRLELAISFVAGVMLGVGLLHMLPHAFLMRLEAMSGAGGEGAHGTIDHASAHTLMDPLLLWVLGGFLAMFFIERFFCYHHHEAPISTTDDPHAASCAHHSHADDVGGHHKHRLTWTGAAIGLSLHSLIEGIALAAAVEVGRQSDEMTAIAGLGVFLVIFLHKPFDALTIVTLMSAGRHSKLARLGVNVAFSLLVPVGVAVFYLGLMRQQDGQLWVSSALAFSAGTFLCIAMSDLLPELKFHQHDRIKLSASLLLGLTIAWAIGAMEARMHTHDHEHHDHAHDHNCDHDHDHDHEH